MIFLSRATVYSSVFICYLLLLNYRNVFDLKKKSVLVICHWVVDYICNREHITLAYLQGQL